MGFVWRSWRTETAAGVSGWDPLSPPTLVIAIGCIFGFVVFLSTGLSWQLATAVLTVGVFAGLTSRYRLVISPFGYRLWRTVFLVIPWQIGSFSRQATVYVQIEDDDFGLDVGPCISEWLTANNPLFLKEITISFGTNVDCQRVVHRANLLAFLIGCKDEPPDELPEINKEVKIAVPNMTRRMRWRRKATHENN